MPLTQEDTKQVEQIAEIVATKVAAGMMNQYKTEATVEAAEMRKSINKLIDMFSNGQLEAKIESSFKASLSDPVFENKLKGFVDGKIESSETAKKIRTVVREELNSEEYERKIKGMMVAYFSTSIWKYILTIGISVLGTLLVQFFI